MRWSHLLCLLVAVPAAVIPGSGCISGKDSDPADAAILVKDVAVDQASTGTFSLKGTISVIPVGGCTAGDTNVDCAGNVYWGVFDQPVTNLASAKPLFANIVKDARDGASFLGQGIPVKASLYLSAFLDDNGNMTLTSPLPDKGDPVYYDLNPFTAKAGETVTRNIPFLLRLP